MRRLLCLLAILIQPLASYAQGATWLLQNEFEIAVLNGESTGLKPPDGNMIASISFDPVQYKKGVFSPGAVQMVDLHSDKLVTYGAKINDSTQYGMVMFGIPTLQNLYVTLYVMMLDESTYRYSYALAFDMDKGSYLSAKDHKSYLVFVGTMRRSTLQADPAQEFVQNEIRAAGMENLYTTVAGQMTAQFIASMQPTLKREITDEEKQRLNVFWYKKIKELMPESALQDVLTPVANKYLSADEMNEINIFFRTATGRKYLQASPIMSREAEGAGASLASKLMSPDTIAKLLTDLKAEFPYWF